MHQPWFCHNVQFAGVFLKQEQDSHLDGWLIQALHQLEAADNSGDGKLTLSEMMSNPYVFYSRY